MTLTRCITRPWNLVGFWKSALASLVTLSLLCLIMDAPSPALAQELATRPDAIEKNSGEADRLTIVGDYLGADENILPGPSSNSSAYGNGRDVLDTPRSVSTVTQTILQDDQIRSLYDLQRATSGTYEADALGLPGLPLIRGSQGELFYNGIRRGGNNASIGLPLSLNPVESIDVVKGLTTPVYGPTSNVAGSVNLVTKTGYLDTDHGEINGTYGTYDYKRYQVDTGGPLIKDRLGFRVSFEQDDEGSYYRNTYYQSVDVYAALAWKPDGRFRLDANFEYLDVPRYPATFGINRPTQDLIDHGTYLTGQGVSPYTGTIPGPLAVVTPTGTTQIDRSNVLAFPQDIGQSETYIGQITGTYQFNTGLSVTNRTYAQAFDQETVAQTSYVNLIPENYTLENRTEVNWNFDVPLGLRAEAGNPPPVGGKADGKSGQDAAAPGAPLVDLRNTVVAGWDFRFLHTVAYENDLSISPAAGDLSQPLSQSVVPASLVGAIYPVFPVPGYPANVLATSGGSYPTYVKPTTGQSGTTIRLSNSTDIYQGGVFWQHRLAFTPWLNLDFGGRGDLLAITSTDPLPPPGFAAASDSTVIGEGQANASLTLKPASFANIYGTFGFNQVSDDSLGGGYVLDGTNRLSAPNFHVPSHLYEVGGKANLFNGTLFLGVAGYQQNKIYRNFDGTIAELDFRGVDFDASYQPNRRFHAFASLSYLQAHTVNSVLETSAASVNDNFNDARPDLIQGTGLGNPRFVSFGPGNLRVPDLPSLVFNGTVSYTFDCGVGGLIHALVTNEQNLDIAGQVKIPTQFNLDAAVFYRRKHLEVRLDVFNFTDERNWSPESQYGYFGPTTVLPELPIRVQGTVALKL